MTCNRNKHDSPKITGKRRYLKSRDIYQFEFKCSACGKTGWSEKLKDEWNRSEKTEPQLG